MLYYQQNCQNLVVFLRKQGKHFKKDFKNLAYNILDNYETLLIWVYSLRIDKSSTISLSIWLDSKS